MSTDWGSGVAVRMFSCYRKSPRFAETLNMLGLSALSVVFLQVVKGRYAVLPLLGGAMWQKNPLNAMKC
jgi:hypothetical protein